VKVKVPFDPLAAGLRGESAGRSFVLRELFSHSDNLGGNPAYSNAFRSGPIG